MKIALIGAGNAGFAMAAHLSHSGHQINLWNRTKANIDALMKCPKIICRGAINDQVPIHCVTNDLKLALSDVELVLVTTPANAHGLLGKWISQYLNNNVVVILNPGRTFGALEFLREFRLNNTNIQPMVLETQTILHTCRKINQRSINIMSVKKGVLVSTFNPNDNTRIVSKLPKVLKDQYSPAKTMLETSLGNVGLVLHCAPLVLNTGWVENMQRGFKFYQEGISQSVGKFIELIDQERLSVSKKLGLKIESTKNWIERIYSCTGDSLFDTIQNNKIYDLIEAPNTLTHRYIYEDVPFGLVPLESLGGVIGVPMPYTKLIIDLANNLVGENFRVIGRSIESLENDLVREEFNYLFKGAF